MRKIISFILALALIMNLAPACLAAMIDSSHSMYRHALSSRLDRRFSVPTENPAGNGDFPVRILNQSDYLMSVALVYFDSNKRQLRCEGWWNVKPHDEFIFNLCHLKGRPIFYYVECQDRPYSKLKSDKGVDWRVSKIRFSYCKGDPANLVNPYKVHFVRGGPTDAGWWQLTIK